MRIVATEDVAETLDWYVVVEALKQGHRLPKAKLGDQFLTRDQDTLLSRAAWIDGLGVGVKSMTIVPENTAKGLPSVQGGMLVFDDTTGAPEALIEGPLVTYWKTASDSALGARLLARPESEVMLVVGAGTVAESLIRAYSAVMSNLKTFLIWNRSPDKAVALAHALSEEGFDAQPVTDLQNAAGQADIVSTATMARTPVLKGEWITEGTHVDLIGAFKADMREADDALLQKGRLFVDSRETTIEHIGELMIPIASRAITEDAVLGDFNDLCNGGAGRRAATDITVFKNGGGAHLDLMTAKAILGHLRTD